MIDIMPGDRVKTPDGREGNVLVVEMNVATVAFDDGTHAEYQLEELEIV